jgi:butyryl-CoA dehydrogenase
MPIEFTFSDEQNLFRKSAREFLEREIEPRVDEINRTEEWPVEELRKLGFRGYMGVPFPRKYGGIGLGEVEYDIIMEELGRVDLSFQTTVGAHCGLACQSIYMFGDEEQRQKYLVPLAKGEKIGAFGLTEPEAGSDAAAIKTTFVKKGGGYVLNGSKQFISNGDVADVVTVFATSDPSIGHRGISAFIVEMNTPGFSPGKLEDKMGIRGSHTAELYFEDCEIPEENLLGPEGRGFSVALTVLDGGRASLSAGFLGAAERSLELALDHVRKTVPPGDLMRREGLVFQLADLATQIEAARTLCFNVGALIGDYIGKVANHEEISRELREMISRKAAMTKTFVTETASYVIDGCLQILGLDGYRKSGYLGRGFEDSFIGEIYEGTNDINRLVVGTDLVKRGVDW